MGSVGNSNQWQPYAYRDCSLEICSIYCPQWCYIIFPPPPPFGYGTNSDSGTDFSPLIIAIIGILASAFILVSYYTIISKYCRNRAATSNSNMEMDDEENLSQIRHENQLQAPLPPAGLDEALIKSITVCKYKRGDGLVEGTDCSVCLSEFEENESLRLLPKCSHAFHLPCIDTWLKSHSTCPLCRSNISPINLFPPPTQEIQRTEHLNSYNFQYQHRSNDTVVVVVVQDLPDLPVSSQETAVLGLENDGVSSKNQRQSFVSDNQDSEPRNIMIHQVRQDDAVQPFRRSVSLNSLSWQGQVSVADILRASQDSEEEVEEDELQMGIGSSKAFVQEDCHSRVSNLEMHRSISTGKLGFTNYGNWKGKSCIIPG
ncbi:RING-H2 finger protein ATL51-like [Cucurbita maxima]|uniref:RING-type E3 ubiquitin transferase n=1 Tax=Cucurbita maxima TaxID=3661 RepID=A0A6J1IC58_CUCMA|nr:RING-H2 finger protein ATL51-like [Cucurbita maxima]